VRRDRVLVREDIPCNDKGFQIRHLELPSRGDTRLEALLREQTAGPFRNPPFHIKPLAARRPLRKFGEQGVDFVLRDGAYDPSSVRRCQPSRRRASPSGSHRESPAAGDSLTVG
jgi:hypothetical protein